jgi:AcrR family transcriptional regulator
VNESVALLARALDSRVEPPDDAVSTRILDAALSLAAASGVRHLTMDDVARRAGVGRMTVYRRFGDKARLLEALGVREGRRCLAALDAATTPDQPIEEQIVEGFVASLRIAREHPLLSRLARIEPDAVLRSLTADGSALFALAREAMAHRLRQAQRAGTLGEVPVEEAAELLVRLSLSFALIEDSVLPLEDPERARDLARRLVAPIVS